VFSFHAHNFEEEAIPAERIRPNVINLVPTSSYIKNERHYYKYKTRGRWYPKKVESGFEKLMKMRNLLSNMMYQTRDTQNSIKKLNKTTSAI